MIVHIEIERTAKALDKRDRPWVRLVPLRAALDRLVDVILRNRGADDLSLSRFLSGMMRL